MLGERKDNKRQIHDLEVKIKDMVINITHNHFNRCIRSTQAIRLIELFNKMK